MNKAAKITNRFLAIFSALILLQTLFFKFTAHPDSVLLFTELGMEPWGRISIGVFELIAGFLLLNPKTMAYGSVLSFGIISGAVFFHVFIIGVEVNNDGGALFAMAIAVFLSSIVIIILNRERLISDARIIFGLKKS